MPSITRAFFKKKWVPPLIWILISLIVYLSWGDGLDLIRKGAFAIVWDFLTFLIGLLVWLAFFAQFVLPVRTFRDRAKIFDRIMLYFTGRHGPAIYVKDGQVQSTWLLELEKEGPGVIWLDSASAAVTRTAAAYKQVLGPGVHFTDKDESLDQESVVDLHTQVQSLGPREQEDVFAPESDEESSEYDEIQKRRQVVSAWTRDGIEVVPNITVIFKIDAPPAKGADAGSRFGFDAEAVRKAVTGEGNVPPGFGSISSRTLGWNRLPALLAADLWREYLAKFTLAQLFETDQSPPPEPSGSSGPVPAETQVSYEPASLAGGEGLDGMLHELNVWLARLADRCEFSGKDVVRVKPDTPRLAPESPPNVEKEQLTALQVINHMVKARMTRAEVPLLDDSGRQDFGTLDSPEYKLLRERGLKVISVRVGGLRFAPAVEDQLVRQWSANWLDNARAEHERVERQRSFAELDEKIESIGAYARSLSLNLLRVNPGQKDPKGTLKTLLLRTRDELVRNDRLHHRAGLERDALEEVIQWIERNEA